MDATLPGLLLSGTVAYHPVLSIAFDLGSQTKLSGYFAPAGSAIGLQLLGEGSVCDLAAVAGVAQFAQGNTPAAGMPLTLAGVGYVVRTVAADADAYVLGLVKGRQ